MKSWKYIWLRKKVSLRRLRKIAIDVEQGQIWSFFQAGQQYILSVWNAAAPTLAKFRTANVALKLNQIVHSWYCNPSFK